METNFLLIVLLLMVLVCYFVIEYAAYEKASNKLVGHTEERPVFSIVMALNLGGIFLFGAVPFLIFKNINAPYELPLQTPSKSVILSIFLFSVIAFTISVIGAKQKIVQNNLYAHKPTPSEMSTITLPGGLTVIKSICYFSIRLPYLFCYEYFFRGVLLFNTSVLTGWLIAIVLNVLFYFLAHILSSKAESIGTIPFGISVCYICYQSQSFLPAFIIHLVLSFTYEGLLLTHHFIHQKKLSS